MYEYEGAHTHSSAACAGGVQLRLILQGSGAPGAPGRGLAGEQGT